MTRALDLRWILLLVVVLMATACGGANPPAPTDASSAQGDAIARVGTVTVRASPIQTSLLDPAVAQQYGIVRGGDTILLLVAVRQGTGADDTSLPAQITASATDLRGQKQAIAMREVRTVDPSSGARQVLIDYVGTFQTTLPETLRFDVKAVRDGKAVATMRFNREFYPR